MKPRNDVIAEAAQAFASKLSRREAPKSMLDSVLPEATKDLAEVQPFEQKTVVPRKMHKFLPSSIIERVLKNGVPVTTVVHILTDTERDYVLAVLDEVYAWAEGQGFEVVS